MSFEEDLSRKARAFEEHLRDRFPKAQFPQIIYESMGYSLFAGGKRVRPVMLLEAAKVCGHADEEAVYLAAGVEMIHTYSLIHDDLPCMDDDELRRGKPTNHVVYGYPMAVLAGDGLLNLAFETMLAGYFPARDKDGYMRALSCIAMAAGAGGMVGGQVADMLAEGKAPDALTLAFIHRHKTGALLCASVEAGALCAGAQEEELGAFRSYGESVGEMFQIVDDILDVSGSADDLGKKTGMDAAHGKMTYPAVHGLDASKRRVEELYEISAKALRPLGKRAAFFLDLASYLKMRKH